MHARMADLAWVQTENTNDNAREYQHGLQQRSKQDMRRRALCRHNQKPNKGARALQPSLCTKRYSQSFASQGHLLPHPTFRTPAVRLMH